MELNRKRIPNYLMIATIVVVIIWFNFSYFKSRISSNHQSISEYDLSDEDVGYVADLAIAAVFYPAAVYQKNENNGGIKHKHTSSDTNPIILVEPHYGYRRASLVAMKSYNHLLPFASKIKNIFLLAPAHNNHKGAFLPATNTIKTPLGDVSVNKTIKNELLKLPIFKDNQKYYTSRNSLNIQLPFIITTFKSIKIIPILYGEVNPQELAAALIPYINNKNILITIADLNGYFISADKQPIKHSQPLDAEHVNCGTTGLETTKIIAKHYSLVPQLLSAEQNEKYETFSSLGRSWSYDEPEERTKLRGIDLYEHNLNNFIRHHHKELIDVVNQSLLSGAQKRYRVKRKHFNNFLFNRGASFITIYRNNKLLGSCGEVVASGAVAADIANNIFKILNSLPSHVLADMSDISVNLQLITDLVPIKFSSQADLLQKIDYGVDGVLVRAGEREGFLMPDAWLEVDNKEDFLTKLKLNAGLSPTYWSNDLKFFKFRMIEVKR